MPQTMLESVKTALGITGTYMDSTLQQYINEVVAFLNDSGVPQSRITVGIVTRGVSDLWNFGSSDGKLSSYFMMRASQLAYSN